MIPEGAEKEIYPAELIHRIEKIPSKEKIAPKRAELIRDEGLTSCKHCGSEKIITDYKQGDIFCKDCGLVLRDAVIDFGAEWRTFDEEQLQKRTRIGSPLKFAKQAQGLTTEIDRYDRDIHGGAIPAERKAQLYRLRKWQRRSRMSDSIQRNLSIALPELDRMCSHLNIPNNLKEECAVLYRKALHERLVRGRSIESVVGAAIYKVSKGHDDPKSLEEIEAVSGVKKKELGKAYRSLCRKLGIKMPITTPTDYVQKFSSKSGFSGETTGKAIEILEKAVKKGITAGRSGRSSAGAAMYIAGRLTHDRRTQEEIGKIFGTTELTVRNVSKELVKELKIELTPDVLSRKALLLKQKLEELEEKGEVPYIAEFVRKMKDELSGAEIYAGLRELESFDMLIRGSRPEPPKKFVRLKKEKQIKTA